MNINTYMCVCIYIYIYIHICTYIYIIQPQTISILNVYYLSHYLLDFTYECLKAISHRETSIREINPASCACAYAYTYLYMYKHLYMYMHLYRERYKTK